jgi:tRNA modification GTPase
MKQSNQDCICAVATGGVEAAIALIRLSGEDALQIISKSFIPVNKQFLTEPKASRLYFGKLYHEDELIDEVLVSVFHAPKSYTGENLVEISCHGSVYIQKKILNVLLANGSRMAEPGEFTKRAFLNGKLDLNQAEAVSDLIASESKAAHDLALQQMKGGFSKEIASMRNDLLNLVSLMELELDFSEEDVEFADRAELKRLMQQISEKISMLLEGFQYGNVIKNGMPVVIIGKPNVGKSTLLNLLLKEDRAIVSEIPGTTRDSIEDEMVIEGLRFRFIDTAGIRETNDLIEGEGIKRAYNRIKKAGIILLLTEATDDLNEISQIISSIASKLKQPFPALFILQNKTDLYPPEVLNLSKIKNWENIYTLSISAKTGEGIPELTIAMVEYINSLKGNAEIVLSNMRHVEALQNAKIALQQAMYALQHNVSGDLVSQDLREVLHHLGLITGQINTEEVLGAIFNRFCIGK